MAPSTMAPRRALWYHVPKARIVLVAYNICAIAAFIQTFSEFLRVHNVSRVRLVVQLECPGQPLAMHARLVAIRYPRPQAPVSIAIPVNLQCPSLPQGISQCMLILLVDFSIVGYFQNETKMTACFECGPGRFSVGNATACSLCPVATAGSTSRLSKCPSCGVNTKQPTLGATACIPCPKNSVSNVERTECLCELGFYMSELNVTESVRSESNATESAVCNSCTDAMECNRQGLTLASVELRDGWWRPAITSQNLYPCLEAANCKNGTCASYRTGILCAVSYAHFEIDSFS